MDKSFIKINLFCSMQRQYPSMDFSLLLQVDKWLNMELCEIKSGILHESQK